jgi:hypothetical protein
MKPSRAKKSPAGRDASEKLSLHEFIPYKLAVVANLSQSIGSFREKYGIQIPSGASLRPCTVASLALNEVVDHTSMDKWACQRAQRRLAELDLVIVRDDPRDGRRLRCF